MEREGDKLIELMYTQHAMTIPHTALTPFFYNKWLTIFAPTCLSCLRRGISTTAAINKGLRASKAEKSPARESRGGRNREPIDALTTLASVPKKKILPNQKKAEAQRKRLGYSAPLERKKKKNAGEKHHKKNVGERNNRPRWSDEPTEDLQAEVRTECRERRNEEPSAASNEHDFAQRASGPRILKHTYGSRIDVFGEDYAAREQPHSKRAVSHLPAGTDREQPQDSNRAIPDAVDEKAAIPTDPENLLHEIVGHVSRIQQLERKDEAADPDYNEEYQSRMKRTRKLLNQINTQYQGNETIKRLVKKKLPDFILKRGPKPLGARTVVWKYDAWSYELLVWHHAPVDGAVFSKNEPYNSGEKASQRFVDAIERLLSERLESKKPISVDSKAKSNSVDASKTSQVIDRDQLEWLKKRAQSDEAELTNLKEDVAKLTEALRASEREKKEQQQQGIDAEEGHPVSIPYTTASSQFLYGTNTVLAALRAGRRKLYALHTVPLQAKSQSGPGEEIMRLAKQNHITIHAGQSTRLLNAMSDDRPHNNFVLEASALPSPPVLSLGRHDLHHGIIPLALSPQSAEEIAVNGAPTAIPAYASPNQWRYPLVLFLDGITDPGNLGNILRTAHFYSVDAVCIATNTCAPLSSAVVAKASAGACETLTILRAPKPSAFIHDSRIKGNWRIYASVAPPAEQDQRANSFGTHTTSEALSQNSPLLKNPCILMLGAEGEGLRDIMLRRADHKVSVMGGSSKPGSGGNGVEGLRGGTAGSKNPMFKEAVDVGVESLNVGVAAGVLLDSFMRKPKSVAKEHEKGKLW